MKEEIWNALDSAIQELLKIASGKTVVLWGYDTGGWFVEHLLKLNNRKPDYIVDKRGRYNRPYFIRQLNPKTSVVILSFSPDRNVTESLEELGFLEGESFVYFSKLIYYDEKKHKSLSYIHYLEETQGLNLTKPLDEPSILANEESHVYAPSADYSLVDIMKSFYIDKDDSVFDIGCGKGASLIIFHKAGFSNIGGVEFDLNLCKIARDNLTKIGAKTNQIICADARLLKEELDGYNFFYMYDPFEGEMFYEAIKRIEESYERRKRKVFLIYTVPTCHGIVIKDGYFVLCKQIETDFLDYRTTNIYCIPF